MVDFILFTVRIFFQGKNKIFNLEIVCKKKSQRESELGFSPTILIFLSNFRLIQKFLVVSNI